MKIVSAALAFGLATVTVIGVGALSATPAHAAPTGRIIADPCLNMRNGPTGSATQIDCVPKNTTVGVECQSVGSAVSGPYGSDNLWDGIIYNGKRGFVSDAYVFTNSNSRVAGDCPSNFAQPNTPPQQQPPQSGRAVGQKDTVNRGASGNCTWGALEQWKSRAGYYPKLAGNAKDWANSARQYGWTVVADAQPESIVVFQPGVQGADHTYGHVGYVTGVQARNGALFVTFQEMNGTAGFNKWDTRTVQDVRGMSYILRP